MIAEQNSLIPISLGKLDKYHINEELYKILKLSRNIAEGVGNEIKMFPNLSC